MVTVLLPLKSSRFMWNILYKIFLFNILETARAAFPPCEMVAWLHWSRRYIEHELERVLRICKDDSTPCFDVVAIVSFVANRISNKADKSEKNNWRRINKVISSQNGSYHWGTSLQLDVHQSEQVFSKFKVFKTNQICNRKSCSQRQVAGKTSFWEGRISYF